MLVAVGAASVGRRVVVICSTAEHSERLMLRYGSQGGMIRYFACPHGLGCTHTVDAVIDVRSMAEQEVARG